MADAGNEETFGVAEDTKRLFAPVLAAMRRHAARIAAVPGLAAVRPGFQATAEQATAAIVLVVMPPATAATARGAADLSRTLDVPVAIEEASPQDQVAYFARGAVPSTRSDFLDLLEPPPAEVVEFRPPIVGKYQPPADAPKLDPVEEQMVLTIATSPDAGWPTFREFLAQPVRRTMHVGIYQFTAPHVYKALRRAMLDDDDATLTMTLHPVPEKVPESGTKADDIAGPEVLDRLARALGERFQYAHTTVGSSGEFASSYHIKVAVVDRARMFLSSGNWQSSNQPPFDPLNEPEGLPPGFHRKFNREHHVVIENASLARIFATYLEHDFERANMAAPEFAAPGAGTAAAATAPDLLLPLEEEEFLEFAPPTFFEPLTIRDKVKVRPVLTPDNYPDVAYDLVKGAKKRLWIQNQYINLNPAGDLPKFKRLVNLLREKAGKIDVRIICRDLMKSEKLDMLLAIGFPREVFKFMSATHTKVIIADDDRVMIGSHNLSNEGVVSNRDASVVIYDRRAVEFCAEVFDHDWTRRATGKPRRSQPRLARPGERAPAGSARVHWSAVFDEPPEARATARSPRVPVPPAVRDTPPDATDNGGRPPQRLVEFDVRAGDNGAGGGVTDVQPDTVYVNGIHARTGEPLVKPRTIGTWAGQLRGKGLDVPQEVMASVQAARFRAFGLPDSVDPNDLRHAGWGVVVPEGRKQQLLDALKPLVDHRRATVPADRCKVLTYKGQSCREWLRQHGMAFGSQKPTIVPYHLLLAGTPEEIPFEFQYLLDLEYSVGRLSFDDVAGFTAYCEALVRTETAGTSRARKALWFAPRHDPATVLSHDELVEPLINGDPDDRSGTAAAAGYANVPLLGGAATRANLLKSLADERPALLFTASHGLGLDRGDPEQRALQGALLTADWSGSGPAGADKCLAGQHVKVDVSGMVAFLFACYGAGTPLRDEYRKDLALPADQIADKPFVAALPQALLASGALAVIGHVERAWGCSIRPAGVRGDLLGPFRNLIGRVMAGRCVGNATRDFSDRSAVLSHELLELLRTHAPNVDDQTLVWNWVERNDARSYVTLGDPAVRLQ